MKTAYLFCSLLIVLSFSTYGGVYKKIDEHGNVSFTDTPTSKDQKPVDIDPPVTFQSKPPPPKAKAQKKEEVIETKTETETEYESLSISSPTNDQSVRENAGNVTVTVSSQPALDLDAKHRYILYLNGKKISESQRSTIFLPNTDRGTHTLSVEIVDNTQTVLIKSDPSTFHLQRIAIRAR